MCCKEWVNNVFLPFIICPGILLVFKCLSEQGEGFIKLVVVPTYIVATLERLDKQVHVLLETVLLLVSVEQRFVLLHFFLDVDGVY